jgi:hypothetical protein
MDEHLGARVRVTQSVAGVPAELEADLFAIDGARGLAVLRRVHAHTYQKADYFFIPIAAITAVVRLGDGAKTAVASVGLGEVRRRLHDSTEAELRKIACRGVGVSEQDQRLFNELRKQCVGRAPRGFLQRAQAHDSAPSRNPSRSPPPATRARRGQHRRWCSMTRARYCDRRTRSSTSK